MTTSTRERLSDTIANSVTHGVGAILAIAGLVVLVVLAATRGTVWHVVSCAIYGSTLVLLYLSSTLYHSLQGRRVKKVFRVFDHSSIYLLIAGTYTPFLLVTLRGGWGWTLFGILWGLTIAGVVFKSLMVDRFPAISTTIYIAMGWLAVFAIKPLVQAISISGMAWIVAGGLAYTLGVVFFALDRKRFFHAIWHLFVLAGSVLHYIAVLRYVLPRG